MSETKSTKPSAAAAAADATATTGADTAKTEATHAKSKSETALIQKLAEYEERLEAAAEDAHAKNSLINELKEQLGAEKKKNALLQENLELSADALLGAQNTIKTLEAKLKTQSADEQAEKLFYTNADETVYQVTVPEFRYKGELHNSAEVLANKPQLLDELIAAGNSILKKID